MWFEEPVSSDDLAGLHLIRDQGPGGMDIAAGEYGYDLHYFQHMLDAEAVDVLQADVTRCGGVTGFLQVGALCSAHCLELSAHCAPSESFILAPPSCRCGRWNFSTITTASNTCCSTALESEEGRPAARPVAARNGTGIQARRRRALPDLEKLVPRP